MILPLLLPTQHSLKSPLIPTAVNIGLASELPHINYLHLFVLLAFSLDTLSFLDSLLPVCSNSQYFYFLTFGLSLDSVYLCHCVCLD